MRIAKMAAHIELPHCLPHHRCSSIYPPARRRHLPEADPRGAAGRLVPGRYRGESGHGGGAAGLRAARLPLQAPAFESVKTD